MDQLTKLMFAIIAATFVVFLAITIPICIVEAKYRKFVREHSVALKRLLVINQRYNFIAIDISPLRHSYDNQNFYDDISPEDYLIYQLAYKQKPYREALKDAYENWVVYQDYKNEINNKCKLKEFDTDRLPRNVAKLYKKEEVIFEKNKLHPIISYYVDVYLTLTNISGQRLTRKHNRFDEDEISDLIDRVNKKFNGFYQDEDIWQSICRVERGKVTNKMRFAIYRRDGNRCLKCGRTRNLEIDHIIPIAKGGKSNFDNLQTLCHRCNAEKSDKIVGSYSKRRSLF